VFYTSGVATSSALALAVSIAHLNGGTGGAVLASGI
jgi:hypothetical protein